MRSLPQCLLDADPVRLKAIARFWDVDLVATGSSGMAAELAETMKQPEAARGAWDSLLPDERSALTDLVGAEGQMAMRVFTRQWGEIRAMGPGRMEREQPWLSPVSAAEGLWYHGFIFSSFEQGSSGFYEVVLVPAELQRNLPVSTAPRPRVTLVPVAPPTTIKQFGETLLDDACTILAYCQNELVRPGPLGTWPDRHRARLLRQLRERDRQRLELLRHLLSISQWLRPGDGGHLRPDPAHTTEWLKSVAAEQRRELAQAWRDDPTWNDLAHVPTLVLEDTGTWHNDPVLARKAVLGHLGDCAPETWYGIDEFIAEVRRTDPDFQRPGGDYTAWYIRRAGSDEYLSGFETWDTVEGALIRHILTSPMSWLGLIDCGAPSADELPSTFCVTHAGAVFLDLAAPASEPAPDLLALQPDFAILVPAGRRYERFQLGRVASWVKTGDVYVYRLTPRSLAHAREQGITAARVLEFLARVTSAPVPRFFEAALTRWEARGGEARLEQAVLLRLASQELMDQVMGSSWASPLIRERIGPTAAIVLPADWPRVVTALARLGLLPDICDLEKDDAD
jgi:hypothetical protein